METERATEIKAVTVVSGNDTGIISSDNAVPILNNISSTNRDTINSKMDSGNSTDRASEDTTIAGMSVYGLIRLIIIFVIACICYISFQNGLILFSWHPTLMIIGFLLLMTEAISAFSSNSYLSRNLKHDARLTLHWALQISAATCILIAFLSIYNHKINNNGQHFVSLHSNFGLYTCILTAGTISGGILAKYSAGLSKFIRPVFLKIVHSTFGAITYILSIITICLGLDSNWFRSNTNAGLVTTLIILTVLVGLFTVIKPIITILTRVRLQFNRN